MLYYVVISWILLSKVGFNNRLCIFFTLLSCIFIKFEEILRNFLLYFNTHKLLSNEFHDLFELDTYLQLRLLSQHRFEILRYILNNLLIIKFDSVYILFFVDIIIYLF